MKPTRLNPHLSSSEFDAALGSALGPDDAILPSSGFLDSVMTAVHREAVAPAPIPFPWKRAIPGMAAAVAVCALLAFAIVSVLRAERLEAPAPVHTQTLFATLLHPAAAGDAFWLLLSLAISMACLFLCRRLIAVS